MYLCDFFTSNKDNEINNTTQLFLYQLLWCSQSTSALIITAVHTSPFDPIIPALAKTARLFRSYLSAQSILGNDLEEKCYQEQNPIYFPRHPS